MSDRRRRDALRDQIARTAHRRESLIPLQNGGFAVSCRCGWSATATNLQLSHAKRSAAQLHRQHARRAAEASPLYKDQPALPFG